MIYLLSQFLLEDIIYSNPLQDVHVEEKHFWLVCERCSKLIFQNIGHYVQDFNDTRKSRGLRVNSQLCDFFVGSSSNVAFFEVKSFHGQLYRKNLRRDPSSDVLEATTHGVPVFYILCKREREQKIQKLYTQDDFILSSQIYLVPAPYVLFWYLSPVKKSFFRFVDSTEPIKVKLLNESKLLRAKNLIKNTWHPLLSTFESFMKRYYIQASDSKVRTKMELW